MAADGSRDVDPVLALVGTASRLYQSVTKETALRFTEAECRAWAQFCESLEALGIIPSRFPQVIESADSVDPIRYFEEPQHVDR
jgi:hypothetical protein